MRSLILGGVSDKAALISAQNQGMPTALTTNVENLAMRDKLRQKEEIFKEHLQ